MVAMAEWLFDQGAAHVRMHPDGMHLKHFDLPAFLVALGFKHGERSGKTAAGGRWLRDGRTLEVYPRPGLGDVVGEVEGQVVEVEAKGGVSNTLHPGQRSRLRRHLCEAVGQLLASDQSAARQIAAVPKHRETVALSRRMASRCRDAGIEIALVSEDGAIEFAKPAPRV